MSHYTFFKSYLYISCSQASYVLQSLIHLYAKCSQWTFDHASTLSLSFSTPSSVKVVCETCIDGPDKHSSTARPIVFRTECESDCDSAQYDWSIEWVPNPMFSQKPAEPVERLCQLRDTFYFTTQAPPSTGTLQAVLVLYFVTSSMSSTLVSYSLIFGYISSSFSCSF